MHQRRAPAQQTSKRDKGGLAADPQAKEQVLLPTKWSQGGCPCRFDHISFRSCISLKLDRQ
eukprot:jgi/Chlat1/7641/Chrsp64S07166